MERTIKPYLQPAFLVCVAVLALAAGSKTAVIEKLGIKLRKHPLPLQKLFEDMDEARLTPYRVVTKSEIPKEIVEALGTTDYIQWFIEDTEAPASSSVRFCSLFITYYTGNPNRVPHVPEECVTGSGDQLLSNRVKQLKLNLGNAKIGGLDITDGEADFDARHLVFLSEGKNVWDRDYQYGVVYFFKVNGGFEPGREETRAAMGRNLAGKYSYFSKVEWKFYGNAGGRIIRAEQEDIQEASEKLLGVLLPILEEDHWPDWDKANAREQD